MLEKGEKVVCINDVITRGKGKCIVKEGMIGDVYRIRRSPPANPSYDTCYIKLDKTVLFYTDPNNYYYIWNYFITMQEYRRLKIERIKDKLCSTLVTK